jgi:hypothetical protein
MQLYSQTAVMAMRGITINRNDDVTGWFNLLAAVVIVVLTVEIVQLNRQNVANTTMTRENNSRMLKQIEEINSKLERKQ